MLIEILYFYINNIYLIGGRDLYKCKYICLFSANKIQYLLYLFYLVYFLFTLLIMNNQDRASWFE